MQPLVGPSWGTIGDDGGGGCIYAPPRARPGLEKSLKSPSCRSYSPILQSRGLRLIRAQGCAQGHTAEEGAREVTQQGSLIWGCTGAWLLFPPPNSLPCFTVPSPNSAPLPPISQAVLSSFFPRRPHPQPCPHHPPPKWTQAPHGFSRQDPKHQPEVTTATFKELTWVRPCHRGVPEVSASWLNLTTAQ